MNKLVRPFRVAHFEQIGGSLSRRFFIRQCIDQERQRFNGLISNPNETFDNQFNALNNIISLKNLIGYVGSDSVYLDFKKYFTLYVKSIEEKDSEYDVISVETIANKLSAIKPKERIELLKYFKWTLMMHGYSEFLDECDYYVNRASMEYYIDNLSFVNFIKLISLWSTSRLINLVLALLLFYIAVFLILLDAPFPSWHMFDVDLQDYSDNILLNHGVNVLTLLFSLKDGMTLHPVGVISVLLAITGKMIYILVLINYFAKKLIKSLKL